MPKDSLKQAHRGIGFVTYTSPDPVDVVLAMPHSLHGVELAVDMATAKEGRVRTGTLLGSRVQRLVCSPCRTRCTAWSWPSTWRPPRRGGCGPALF